MTGLSCRAAAYSTNEPRLMPNTVVAWLEPGHMGARFAEAVGTFGVTIAGSTLAASGTTEEDALPAVACPTCGETERLRGEPRDDGTLEVTCEDCGTVWQRHADRRCGLCGSTDLAYTPKPLWERGRGDQRTPAGEIPAYACWSCGGQDVTSSRPVPRS